MIVIKKDVFGVGSNFLRLLDWLWYSKYSKDEVYIDWNIDGVDPLAKIFDYNNPTNFKDAKTYNHYVGKFTKELDINSINARKKDVYFYDKYGVKSIGANSGYFYTTPNVYYEKDFCLLRNTLYDVFRQRFTLSNEFQKVLIDKKSKTLGVHVRYLQHYCEERHNGPCPISDFKKFLDDCAKISYERFTDGEFERIYVACDMNDFYDSISKYFSEDKIIKISYERLNGNTDWGLGNRKALDLIYNTFLDIFNLSRCDKLICGVSNLTLTSLVVNRDLGFEFFPSLKNLHSL